MPFFVEWVLFICCKKSSSKHQLNDSSTNWCSHHTKYFYTHLIPLPTKWQITLWYLLSPNVSINQAARNLWKVAENQYFCSFLEKKPQTYIFKHFKTISIQQRMKKLSFWQNKMLKISVHFMTCRVTFQKSAHSISCPLATSLDDVWQIRIVMWQIHPNGPLNERVFKWKWAPYSKRES